MTAKTILIVEDNEALLQALARQVQSLGHDVVSHSRFDAAKRYLASHTPDALLTDLRLGAYNGLHLVVMARAKSPTMGIIVYSAHFDPVLRDEAERHRAVFVEKPATMSQFLRTVEDLLRKTEEVRGNWEPEAS